MTRLADVLELSSHWASILLEPNMSRSSFHVPSEGIDRQNGNKKWTSLMRMPRTSVGQRHLTQLLIGEADQVSFNNAATGADQQGLRRPNALVPNAPIRRPGGGASPRVPP